ncbi:hypothetical protein [Alkalihalobacillus alcalophilus]|uniref:hypothetical protein n=1 Tax=Alkalihalobacillus alcalophilus TaxID=1445 RepID=UPI0010A60168|nr:hypothetical protein [Alkalihalobacillus alcalophilus]
MKNSISGLGIYSISEQSDISFYVMYVCSAKVAGSVDITPKKLSIIQVEEFTEENIKRCAEYVHEKYQTLGGNNTVAKGTNLIDAILQDEFIKKSFS